MRYVYPGILFQDGDRIGLKVPDLPGCTVYGKETADVLFLAKETLEMWLWDAEISGETIPLASETLSLENGETFTLIAADTMEYRRTKDNRAVKKTLTIPAWLNHLAEQANAPFSQVLQQGLKEYLKIRE